MQKCSKLFMKYLLGISNYIKTKLACRSTCYYNDTHVILTICQDGDHRSSDEIVATVRETKTRSDTYRIYRHETY